MEQLSFDDCLDFTFRSLNVLIACEESQRVCCAFRELGHNAFSCDIQEPSGKHPEWHILGDALTVLTGGQIGTMNGETHNIGNWDLIIAHPPCTYLSNAGACRLYPKSKQLDEVRYKKGLKAKQFFMEMLNADCPHIAVENPIPSKIYNLPPYSQIIQPYEYGHPFTKKTCLWLKGLPLLKPTNIVKPKGMYVNGNSAIWKRQAERGEVTGKSKSAKVRSKTFEWIAKAMAEQYSVYILKQERNT